MLNNYIADIILNHSIILAAIIGMIRFKFISSDFYPFLFFIWAGLANDSLSLAIIANGGSNTANSNIFVLLELALVLFLFYKWNGGKIKKYYILGGLGLAIWAADNFMLHSIWRNNSLFRVFYSFAIVFLSIDQVNKILVFERGPLLKNAMFLICITFLFYFGCKAFVESFNIFHLSLSNAFLRNLWMTLYFINFIANLLYAVAILWIPTKQKFSLPY
jgi:hypothetical protein